MSSVNISELSNSLNAAANAGPAGIGEEERKQLLQACEKLRSSFESPTEFTLRTILSSHHATVLRLGIETTLFDAASKLSAQGRIGTLQLAAEIGVEHLLVVRIMRILACMGIFNEVDRDLYDSTPLAGAYVSDSPFSAIVINMTYFLKISPQLPEYFKEKGWKCPDDAFNSPFQFATGEKSHYFEFLATKPYYQQAFNTTMALPFRRSGQSWFRFFPVEAKLRVQQDSDVLLVDVGGGQGADITAFKEAYPDLRGRLVLQDLPSAIGAVDKLLPPSIESQGHDFFHEQPVKGAKAYYLRTILHDWPDKQARQILTRIREAMASDSLLLINERLLPDTNVSPSSTFTDLAMMVTFGSLERTREQFVRLLDDSGFELVKVWMPEGSGGSLAEQSALLEARLK